jgi:hypothetical protein
MGTASIKIHKAIGVTLIAICVPLPGECASLFAQDSSSHSVPFVARFQSERGERPARTCFLIIAER